MEKRFLNVELASVFLSVSTSFIYKNAKYMPHHKLGGKILFCPEELTEYVKGSKCNNTVQPSILNEIEQLRVPSLAA